MTYPTKCRFCGALEEKDPCPRCEMLLFSALKEEASGLRKWVHENGPMPGGASWKTGERDGVELAALRLEGKA